MSETIIWLHVGDLHLEAEDGWQSRDRLREIVAQADDWAHARIDFVFLLGDNANHGTSEHYAAMTVRPASPSSACTIACRAGASADWTPPARTSGSSRRATCG